MIKSTNTINIDGNIIDHEDIVSTLKLDSSDKFTRWVVRPLALLTAIAIVVAAFFASAFMIIMSLAMLPIMAVAMWAMKTKLERDIAAVEPVIQAQE